MTTSNARPFFLNLMVIKLPIAGIMSIIHRITGAVMVLAIPLLIWMTEISLSGPEGFEQIRSILHSTIGKIGLFLAMWAFFHHLFAGIRYLLLDIDVGIEKPTYRYTAAAVLVLAPIVAYLIMEGLL